MHEILESLPSGSRVLDLGCGRGSFCPQGRPLFLVRLDIQPVPGAPGGCQVQADAARLPFPDASFDAVISNHSLEHIAELDASLAEVGRVLRAGGALFVAVPDSTTLTDRLYRALARGGGHLNRFRNLRDLIARVEALTALRHAGTRLLFTSLSFLNVKNRRAPAPRSLALIGNGNETMLVALTFLLRLIDRALGTRLSVYGWAMYFGGRALSITPGSWTNVCVRCGAGHPAELLRHRVRRAPLVLPVYRCPDCGAANLFTSDRAA